MKVLPEQRYFPRRIFYARVSKNIYFKNQFPIWKTVAKLFSFFRKNKPIWYKISYPPSFSLVDYKNYWRNLKMSSFSGCCDKFFLFFFFQHENIINSDDDITGKVVRVKFFDCFFILSGKKARPIICKNIFGSRSAT